MVTLAEHDARQYRRDIRRTIAVAGPESHLFTASIRDNVSVLLITHRIEGLDLVDRVVWLASPPSPNVIRHVSTR